MLDVEEQLSRYGEALEHDLVQVVAGLPDVSVHRRRRRRSTRHAAGAAGGAGTYLVEPEAHQIAARARPHTHRRRAIAVLAAAAAVIGVTVAVAVTRPSADDQTKPVAPTPVPQPRPVVPPPSPTSIAHPQLYWQDADGIGRANLDGTAITPHLIPVGVQATCGGGTVAADRNYVYWTIPDPAALADRRPGNTWGEVARARRDGTGVDQSFITTTSPYVPLCVAVDGAHVYWTSVVLSGGVGPKIVIGRANLDGTDVEESFISGISASCLVADGAHIYWDSGGGIGRANVDGTGITDFISIDFIGGFARCGLVVDGGHIYFESNKGIGRANLDGTGVNESFISGPGVSESQPCADDGTYLYWINGLSGPGASTSSIGPIGRARLDGTGGVQEDFIPGVFSSSGCAIGP